LEALKQVSEAISAEHVKHRATIPPRLNHYLTQASFSKALAWLNGAEG